MISGPPAGGVPVSSRTPAETSGPILRGQDGVGVPGCFVAEKFGPTRCRGVPRSLAGTGLGRKNHKVHRRVAGDIGAFDIRQVVGHGSEFDVEQDMAARPGNHAIEQGVKARFVLHDPGRVDQVGCGFRFKCQRVHAMKLM